MVAERIATRLASMPAARIMEELITTAFWASFRREEGRSPRISIAFVEPAETIQPLMFEKRFRLDPDVLARVAPAVERPGVHIGIWPVGDELWLWGITRTIPMRTFVLEVVAPGLLVVKYRRSEPSTKFANVAVLEGADVKFIQQQATMISEAPPALGSLLAFYTSAGKFESDHILVRVAISMRAHGRGGSLLVVPKDSSSWLKSALQPMTYSVVPPFPNLRTFAAQAADEMGFTLQAAVDALAGLTAVDGATVISDDFEPLAFGVKIVVRESAPQVSQVLLTEPVEGVGDMTVESSQLGGTRHLSAAQFAQDQRDAVALVASQDGRFTVFAWSDPHQIVHAHRLEALLI